MRRFLIILLSLAVLVIPTTSWEASTSGNLAINVTPGQAITAVSLSNSNFTGGAPSGTVVGAISVTMSPASPAFSGSLSLSGTNASQFQISGGNLTTNGVAAAGTYQINIVATEAGVTGSPFTQAATITGASSSSSGVEKPGPSAALLGSAARGSGLYSGGVGQIYTCTRNFYVNASTGSDSNNGTSPGTAWATIQHADGSSRAGGDCINVADGTYTGNLRIRHGGTTAATTGYVVYLCAGLDTCQITANNSPSTPIPLVGFTSANYVVFDGFAANCNNYAASIGWASSIPDTTTPAHHLWILNSTAENCALSGVQLNDSEYYFVLHGSFRNNSHTSGYAGSGISFAVEKAVSGYSPTSADTAIAPFHNMVSWNTSYNNICTTCGTHTDGEGIIMDTFSNAGSTNIDYPYQTLVSFNVTYNNGGRGVEIFQSSHITVANNSSYNNNLDPSNGGTERPEIEAQQGTSNPVLNNVVYAIVGPGNLSCNNAYEAGGTGTDGTFSTNIAYLVGSQCFGLNPVGMFSGNTFSCSANKCSTNPKWVDVGNTSSGTSTTPPVGANFALQSGSPAIGYGQTKNYLSAQSVDAGACYHTLTSCP